MPEKEPVLQQNVRWGENYVSHGLNKKLAGIVAPGIYRGFYLKPAGPMEVLVTHAEGESESVAVVERDGYSLTVSMAGSGCVPIPSFGEWFICIEAWYSPSDPGYQRIVARKEREPHHVSLGRVIVTQDGVSLPIPEDNISLEERATRNPIGGLSPELERFLYENLRGHDFNIAHLAEECLRLANRVSLLETGAAFQGASGSGQQGGLPPEGFPLADGGTVAPVTLLEAGREPVPGAAITLVFSPDEPSSQA